MSNKKKIKLFVNGIGPHYGVNSINSEFETEKKRIAIFSNNGIGKTAISRMFALASNNKAREEDPIHYLTKGRNSGKFLFSINGSNDEKKLEITLDAGGINIKNDTDLLFHTFNSDFVKRNVVDSNFQYSGNTDGYIIGESNVEAQKETEQIRALEKTYYVIYEELDTDVNNLIAKLDSKKIKKNTLEYKNITTENLIDKVGIEQNDSETSYIGIEKRYDELVSITGFETVPACRFKINDEKLTEIEEVLSTDFTLTPLEGDFVKRIRDERPFYSRGVEIFEADHDEKCPFCRQKIGPPEAVLIDKYKQYLRDEESKIIDRLNSHATYLGNLISDIKSHHVSYQSAALVYERSKGCFHDLKESSSGSLSNIDGVVSSVNEIIEKINLKKADISKSYDVKSQIEACINHIKELEEKIGKLNSLVEKLQNKQLNRANEELFLRKQMCTTAFSELYIAKQSRINELLQIDAEIEELEREIEKKQMNIKKSRKDEVGKTLEVLLGSFFYEKYTLNKESMKIVFMGDEINENASRILSDGEKSIVAFCYYLASIHTVVENERDYKKIFFVIDDPVSSMDFHYTFVLCNIIKNLDTEIKSLNGIRYIIFTHNADFINILSGSMVTEKVLHLKPGELKELTQGTIILPYECHLDDIIGISEEKRKPSYTTPNSIRHILETIKNFEYPEKDLATYLKENTELNKEYNMYVLIQDFSHGKIRGPTAGYTDEMIINCCKAVFDFINNRYPGQIEHISKTKKAKQISVEKEQ